ncbi:DUF1330 domain-containing protein [uncultured Roseobacter sp.]|uniref:DUF1330 domain-containing protein n=1 Tax=uncultured Roseobacter sp. TaxID=114847 RepID=UPI0026378677|nr:DUF1330 domain-containing protein [uncultured Roseobacter sp.]
MAKGYWIAHVTITDAERYAGYQHHAPKAFAEYGARFVARGGDSTTLEGDPWQRHVIIEFDSKERALACYASQAYQMARQQREGACHASVTITEGLSDSG